MQKLELNLDELDVNAPRLTLEDIVQHVLARAACTTPRNPVPLLRERQLLVLSR